VPSALFDEEYVEHAGTIWHLSDGTKGAEGRWASGPAPDGIHEFGYDQKPQPLGGKASAPKPDPLLYATSPANLGLIEKAIKKLT
jgi:Mn-containing catalase